MPTYEYACAECGERLEAVQKFSDDPLTECPACRGRLRKVFSPVGIVFKGSGFYRNDSRSSAVNGSKVNGSSSSDSSAAGEKSSGADSKSSGLGVRVVRHRLQASEEGRHQRAGQVLVRGHEGRLSVVARPADVAAWLA